MLIQEFNNCIRIQDHASALSLIAKAKSLQYPYALIEYMESRIKNCPNPMIKHPLNTKLESKELPIISPLNYLLFREDLRALGFDKAQAQMHLLEYGFDELIEEEKSADYEVRRYFDLNDSPLDGIAVLLIHSDQRKTVTQAPIMQSDVPIFHASLEELIVYVNELEATLDIQEFAAWLTIRKKIPYLCILDESDKPIEGWLVALSPYLKEQREVVFSEEFVVTNEEPRHTKRNRQYKSYPSLFRIFTRGYVSGIFAIQTALLSRLNNISTTYANTWCLQVDIAQQAKAIPLVVDIPLMVRNQAVNPSLLEYGDESIRSHFRHAWSSYLGICKTNLVSGSLLSQEYPAQIEQGESGEVVFKPKQDMKKLLVSIIIPFRDKVELLKQCIESLLKHESLISYEILLADNGSIEPETKVYIESLLLKPANKVFHIYIDEPFNYSRVNNLAAVHANGDFILLLNNDIEFCAPNPLSRMAAYFAFHQVGAVGATLLFPDLSIQHAGIVLTPLEPYDTFSPYKATREEEYDSYQISLKSAEEWSAATAACLLVRKEVWHALNGLDESLTVAYNDVDFCLRMRELGKSVISVPGLEIKHYESKSRGEDNMGEKYNRLYKEGGMLRSKHPGFFSSLDLFWPKMLSISNPRASARHHDCPKILNYVCKSDITHRVRGHQDPVLRHYCVYVGFDAHSRIRPDVLEQIKSLSRHYNIVYVTTSHESISKDPLFLSLTKFTYKILIRTNIGYDFGSWRAGILELDEEIKESESLLLMNDSLYGPINSLDTVIERTLLHEADIVCMTQNMVGGQHAQSYFTSYKRSIFTSKLFKVFWQTLPVYSCKFTLIKECEIYWTNRLIKEGYKLAALFDTRCFGNQTHINWKELIVDHGFPFVKNELILRNPVGQDLDGMDELLKRNPQLYMEMLSYWEENHLHVLHHHG
jgi:GT2 family glycosyltransferase